jgi:hypothetical protein
MARQTPRFTIKQFMDTHRISGMSISHDEKSILVSSNRTGVFNVFSVPVAGGPMKQLTFSTDDDMRISQMTPALFMHVIREELKVVTCVFWKKMAGISSLRMAQA